MATQLIRNGITFNIPDQGNDPGWGEALTAFLIEINNDLNTIVNEGDLALDDEDIFDNISTPTDIDEVLFVSSQNKAFELNCYVNRYSTKDVTEFNRIYRVKFNNPSVASTYVFGATTFTEGVDFLNTNSASQNATSFQAAFAVVGFTASIMDDGETVQIIPNTGVAVVSTSTTGTGITNTEHTKVTFSSAHFLEASSRFTLNLPLSAPNDILGTSFNVFEVLNSNEVLLDEVISATSSEARTSVINRTEYVILRGRYDGFRWVMTNNSNGNSGVTFSITGSGQVQYTSDNQGGTGYTGTLLYFAKVI